MHIVRICFLWWELWIPTLLATFKYTIQCYNLLLQSPMLYITSPGLVYFIPGSLYLSTPFIHFTHPHPGCWQSSIWSLFLWVFFLKFSWFITLYTAKWFRYIYICIHMYVYVHIYIYCFIFFSIIGYYNVEYSSLCCTVGPCCVSVLCIIVCFC